MTVVMVVATVCTLAWLVATFRAMVVAALTAVVALVVEGTCARGPAAGEPKTPTAVASAREASSPVLLPRHKTLPVHVGGRREVINTIMHMHARIVRANTAARPMTAATWTVRQVLCRLPVNDTSAVLRCWLPNKLERQGWLCGRRLVQVYVVAFIGVLGGLLARYMLKVFK